MDPTATQLQLGCCFVDLLTGQVRDGERSDRLSANELACLTYLARHSGQAVSRDELLEKVWHYDAQVISRTVDATVRRLRKKVESKPSTPVHLLTVHGAGYRLDGVSAPRPATDVWPDPKLQGRAELLDRLRATKARLLTLTGPPGIGKSQLAAALAHHHSGTVLWADLGQSGPGLPDFPSAFGLRGRLPEAFLAMNDPLVVLDDIESQIDALSPVLDAWLAAAPNLSIVCTSRRPLGHRREHAIPIDGLAPSDATVLLGGADADYLALAQALEHNPLALTLANEPCQLLGPRAVLERLQTQRDAFGSGQRALDSAIETSWRLLSPGQQRLLTLASFPPGGLPLQVLERWAGPDTLANVQGLLRHALVRTRRSRTESRIEVPFPVGPFARRFSTPADAAGLQEHLAWWASEQQAQFNGPPGEDARATLRSNAPSLLYAASTPGVRAELCLAHWAVAVIDSMLPQLVLRTLQKHLANRQPQTPELALQLARVHWAQQQFEASRRYAQLGLNLAPQAALRLSLLDALASAESELGEHEAAARADAEADALKVPPEQTLGWDVNRGRRMSIMGAPKTIEMLESVWARAHALGAIRVAAGAASCLAQAYTWAGDLERSEAVLQEALALCKPVGEWSQRGTLLQLASIIAVDRGRVAEAEDFLNQAATTWRALGWPARLDRMYLVEAKIAFLRSDFQGAISILSRGIVTANLMAHRSRGAHAYKGMIRSHQGQYEAGLNDLNQVDLRASPVLVSLKHSIRLLTLLRLGHLDAARQERAMAPKMKMDALIRYQALAHAGLAFYLGDEAAGEHIERSRGVHPPSMEFQVLWGHLDWVTSQVSQRNTQTTGTPHARASLGDRTER